MFPPLATPLFVMHYASIRRCHGGLMFVAFIGPAVGPHQTCLHKTTFSCCTCLSSIYFFDRVSNL